MEVIIADVQTQFCEVARCGTCVDHMVQTHCGHADCPVLGHSDHRACADCPVLGMTCHVIMADWYHFAATSENGVCTAVTWKSLLLMYRLNFEKWPDVVCLDGMRNASITVGW